MGRLNFRNSRSLRLCAKPSSAPTTAPVEMYLMRKILLLQRKDQFTEHLDTGITETRNNNYYSSTSFFYYLCHNKSFKGNPEVHEEEEITWTSNPETHGGTEYHKITQQVFWGWGGGQCGDLKPLYVALLGKSLKWTGRKKLRPTLMRI